MDWKVGKCMEYRISNICSDLSIGKSTVYKRIEILKQNIPEENWKDNDYFYYTKNNKLFITEKGFNFIKNFNNKNTADNIRQDATKNEVAVYQNQIIEIYKQENSYLKQENEYLKQENKRLIDIISVKEQKEIAKDIKSIDGNNSVSFWDKLFLKFKKV